MGFVTAGDFFLETHFSGVRGKGGFSTPNPLFPILWILTPAKGKRIPNPLTPKRPSRTKNTTESEFRYREVIRYGGSETLRRGLRNACFSCKGREAVQTAKNYGGSKTLRTRVPYPDPPIPAFLLKKARNPRKKQGFSSLPNP